MQGIVFDLQRILVQYLEFSSPHSLSEGPLSLKDEVRAPIPALEPPLTKPVLVVEQWCGGVVWLGPSLASWSSGPNAFQDIVN